MAKTGRNDLCPCGSGLKYKKCCLLRVERVPAPTKSTKPARHEFINGEIARLRDHAAARQPTFRLIGALAFFSTASGNAWLLELTEQDAVPVARDGIALAITINETEEVFEIGWTHRFAIKGQLLVTTSYLDNALASHQGCPVREIHGAMEHLRRQYSQRDLASIRLETL